MIGNETDAHDALHGRGREIGEGCSRRAVMINGIVYKIPLMGGSRANVIEFERANAMRGTTPDNVVIPDMYLYANGVLAMPFIEGTPTGECIGDYLGTGCDCDSPCLSFKMHCIISAIHDDSLSWGNTIFNEGIYYLVDLD